jgi:hypothetical protein
MLPLFLFILFEPYALTISLFERALALVRDTITQAHSREQEGHTWFAVFESDSVCSCFFASSYCQHNLIAFVSFYTQWRGLIGSKGISPARELMSRVQERGWTWQKRWRDLPTLTWYSCSDEALNNIQLVGIAASVCAFLGIFSGWSIFVCAVCYSSTKAIGGVFTGLQVSFLSASNKRCIARFHLCFSVLPLMIDCSLMFPSLRLSRCTRT